MLKFKVSVGHTIRVHACVRKWVKWVLTGLLCRPTSTMLLLPMAALECHRCCRRGSAEPPAAAAAAVGAATHTTTMEEILKMMAAAAVAAGAVAAGAAARCGVRDVARG